MGLSPLGIVHTLVSIVALGVGLFVLVKKGRITWSGKLEKIYVLLTAVTCLTALGIFKHGTFNQAHALAILTLLALGGAIAVSRTAIAAKKHVEVTLFTATILFSVIPATVETLTRFPPAAPLAHSPEDPMIGPILGGFALLFVTIAIFQNLKLRRGP